MSAAANHLNRISVDPAINHGKPSIRGLRIPVQLIFELLASGMSFDDIIDDYPILERDDVVAALEYGSALTGNQQVVPFKP